MFDFLKNATPTQNQLWSKAIADIAKSDPGLAESITAAGLGGNSPLDRLTAPVGGLEGLGQIAKGIGSLGQLYGSYQGIKLAKEQAALSRDAYETNLGNQTRSYNTSLEDRVRARYATEGRSGADVSAYLAKHSL